MWDARKGSFLWGHRIEWIKTYRDLEVLPVFSAGGQHIVILTDTDVVCLIDTYEPDLIPVPFKIRVPAESIVAAVALHEMTLAVVSVRDCDSGFSTSNQLKRARLENSLQLLSLCLHSNLDNQISTVRLCFTSDGRVLFVIYAINSEKTIYITSYDVNLRVRIGIAKVETGKLLTYCRLFGTIRVLNEDCVVVGVASDSQRRRGRFLPLTEMQSTERLMLMSPTGKVTELTLGEHEQCQVRQVTIQAGILIFLQWNPLGHGIQVKDWEADSHTFVWRGEVDGAAREFERNLAGIAIAKNRVTWITTDKQFSFSEVHAISEPNSLIGHVGKGDVLPSGRLRYPNEVDVGGRLNPGDLS